MADDTQTDEAQPIAFYYTGGHEPDGRPSRWYEGVPARDITRAEYDALDDTNQTNLRLSAFYDAGEAAPSGEVEADVSKMTRAELDAYATAHGIESPESFSTKADLIAAITAA